MRYYVIMVFALLVCVPAAWADYGLTSKIVTDKMVYTPGEKVYAIIYIENKNKFEEGLMRTPSDDYSSPPAVELHSDAELSGGGDYYRKIADLPVRPNMGIQYGATRPYAAFIFDLVDSNGAPLPEGYYAISHTGIAFRGGMGDQAVTLHVSDAAQVIFVSTDSLHDRLADLTGVTTNTQQRVMQLQTSLAKVDTKLTQAQTGINYLKNLTNTIYSTVQRIFSLLTNRR